MLRSVFLVLVILNSVVSEDEVINEDDVINDEDTIHEDDTMHDDDPDDEIVTDEEIADHTYDPPLEPQVVEVESPPQEETIERVLTTPNLTEEELTSQLMPDRFKCDTCHIVVFSLGNDFKKEESRLPQRKKIKGLDDITVIDIFENACAMEKFEGHVIHEIDGQPKFCGPAFPDRIINGLTMGRGPWRKRYRGYCGGILEEYEEDEIYKHYRSGNLFTELCMKKDCKGVLSKTPEVVDFKPFSRDEL